MEPRTPAESGNESGARCVLWHAPERKPPAELLAALSRRGFGVRAVQGPFDAMAELCLLQRRSRSAPSRHYVLLLVEPESLTRREEVLAARRRYAPGAVAWVYEPGANTPLRELVEEREADRRVLDDGPGRPSPAATGHELRLAGEGPEERPGAVEPEGDRADEDDRGGETGLGHLLTEEELAMLLEESEPRAGGSADGD